MPWSPTVHYLQEVFLPAVAEVGVRATVALRAWGWYPQGQGEMLLTVQPAAALYPVTWLTPTECEDFRAISVLANVARHVGPRQREQLRRGLGWEVPVEEVVAGGAGRGSLVFLWGGHAGFTGLGAKGKPAETVADEVAQAWQAFQTRQAALDRHLADQVVLYLARAPGASRFTTEAITPHLLTNIAVIRDLAGASIVVQGEVGKPGTVICYGKPS